MAPLPSIWLSADEGRITVQVFRVDAGYVIEATFLAAPERKVVKTISLEPRGRDDRTLDGLSLSTRARNALWRNNVRSVGDLRAMVATDRVRRMRNVGPETTNEIVAELARWDRDVR